MGSNPISLKNEVQFAELLCMANETNYLAITHH